MLVLIVGPSGAGKDTLLDAARAHLQGDSSVRFARREITRPASETGEQHLPLDEFTFCVRRDRGDYALWWEAHGLHYGIPAGIEVALEHGVTVVASVSRAVIAEAAGRYPVRVVEITAPPKLLAKRLGERGREDADDIARRLERDVPLPAGIDLITVMNDGTVEQGAQKLLAAIK